MLKGIVLYKGPSVLDGAPIVCIATLNTSNMKTGDMIQTWILREDVAPTVAVKTGQDSSVCGKCPHRHFNKGACYVIPFQAPAQVFKTYHLGKYKDLRPEVLRHFMGRKIRLGSYGDPAAVPYHVWLAVVSLCEGHTGYTHQLGHACFDEKILDYCQVSVDTPNQYQKARKAGHGTFRVKAESQPLLEGEALCLNETSGIACVACGWCDGRSKRNIAINVHGTFGFRYGEKFLPVKNVDTSE